MSGTTALDVKKDLYDKMVAAPAFANIDVWYGYQGGEQGDIPRQVVWLGEIQWSNEKPASLGNLKREESYSIVLTIRIEAPGDSQLEANQTAEALMTAVEDILRDPRWTSIVGVVSSGIVPQLLNEGITPTGRAAILIATVQITARK